MQKLDARTDGATVNIVEESIEGLRELLPDASTESSVEGGPRLKVDLDALGPFLWSEHRAGRPHESAHDTS